MSTSQGPIPVPNSTLPFWRTTPDELDKHRSTPELPEECDILIIGAGFSGASLAYHIYKDNPFPPSVLILEAREACSGATGRNGGHLKPDTFYSIPKHSERYGPEAAVQLARFEASHLAAIKNLVQKEQIDCDFVLTRTCDAIMDPDMAKEAEKWFHDLIQDGTADLDDVHFTSGKYAERISGVKGAAACFTYTAGHLWPYKLVIHLLKSALQRGANLQTMTPVFEVSDNPLPDGRWLVKTERGDVKAQKVIFATNAYTSRLAPQFRNKIIPVKGNCSRIVVPEGKSSPYLPFTYCIRYTHTLYDYLIPRPDGSIVAGGGRYSFWRNIPQWYNVADDSQLIESGKDYFNGLMQRTFIGWEDSGAYTEKVWSGIMGESSDLMPFVGHVPDKEGQAVLAGFSGHGMPVIFLAARGLVQMLLDGKSFEETGLPPMYEVTKERMDSERNEILDDLPAPSASL
ncbi:hypothetical protein Plec18167_008246 [Paecilomyces lecythidis]|uniref:FAD dependent oxidoreductase domain-containing protein n=1 Tax=Paecilomyces lecythidis TaxID=3004212 RepID=A0ABR3WXC7_9EURO